MTTRYWEEINGRIFADQRSVSMTTTAPPKNAALWSNAPTRTDTEDTWRVQRLAWLDQYDLHVSTEPEKGYRYWRWLSTPSTGPSAFQGHRVIWWERRPWTDPLPTTPGLWPQDS